MGLGSFSVPSPQLRLVLLSSQSRNVIFCCHAVLLSLLVSTFITVLGRSQKAGWFAFQHKPRHFPQIFAGRQEVKGTAHCSTAPTEAPGADGAPGCAGEDVTGQHQPLTPHATRPGCGACAQRWQSGWVGMQGVWGAEAALLPPEPCDLTTGPRQPGRTSHLPSLEMGG